MPEILLLVLKVDMEEEEERVKVEQAIQDIMIVGMISHKWSAIIATRMDIMPINVEAKIKKSTLLKKKMKIWNLLC